MRVLVIGGAGYIGSHVVYELIRDKHEVAVMDNLSTGDKSFIPIGVDFIYGDIRNCDDIDNVLTKYKFDVVMHFAAKLIVPESMQKPLEYYHNNVEGVRLLLEGMIKHNVKNIVFSSTAAVYGDIKKDKCKETDLTIPINPYGESKLACERLIYWASIAHKINYTIFRYFNVAGADKSLKIGLKKDQITHLIPAAIQAALGQKDKLIIYGNDYPTFDGTCIRDYIHVTDLAKAHILGAKYILDGNQSDIFNLGSSKGFSVFEVVNSVEKIIPIKTQIGPRRDGDPAMLVADATRAKKVLKFEPKLSLDEMIKSDLDYRKQFVG